MKPKIVFSVFILFLLAGCNVLGQKDISEMDPAELPDVIAFQDDFTREFMSSLEEVEDGYYLFESKTGGYTMMYPENATMNQTYYQKNKDTFETIQFGHSNENAEIPFYVRATYDKNKDTKNTDIYLDLLSSSISYEGEFEQLEYTDKDIYFGTMKHVTELEDLSEKSSTYRFFGFIQSKNNDQAVRYTLNVLCDDEEIGCDYDLDSIENGVKKVMESIEFN